MHWYTFSAEAKCRRVHLAHLVALARLALEVVLLEVRHGEEAAEVTDLEKHGEQTLYT